MPRQSGTALFIAGRSDRCTIKKGNLEILTLTVVERMKLSNMLPQVSQQKAPLLSPAAGLVLGTCRILAGAARQGIEENWPDRLHRLEDANPAPLDGVDRNAKP